MIIDLIMDRHDNPDGYNPHKFYTEVLEHRSMLPSAVDSITRAMDYGEEKDVQKALCDYVIIQKYKPCICSFIKSVSWITKEEYRNEECN